MQTSCGTDIDANRVLTGSEGGYPHVGASKRGPVAWAWDIGRPSLPLRLIERLLIVL